MMKRNRPPVLSLLFFALAVTPIPAAAQSRADVASMQFVRTQVAGLADMPRPGTHLNILLSQGESDWRAIDFDASSISVFTDDRESNLAVADAIDPSAPVQFQPAKCVVAADGQTALISVWGGGLPSKGAEEMRVSGTAAIFCGPNQSVIVDRADVKLSGGETFNVQPFRVVTGRGNGSVFVELRALKSAAFIVDVSMATPAGRLSPVGSPTIETAGQEWVWRGEFELPLKADKGVLSARYLPIERVETVPFDITVGVGFAVASTNTLVRWLKRLL